MAQKNDTPALILALLVTLGLLGGGAWFLAKQFGVFGNPGSKVETGGKAGQTRAGTGASSDGSSSLISSLSTPQKQAAIAAFADRNYTEAAQQFEASLKGKRNDPEALIFKNNALAAEGNRIVVGASLPIAADENAALEMMRGIAQAQDEINRSGGINGQKLFVLLADDADDPETAKIVAQAFSKNKSVVAVVGPYSSGVSLATLDLYKTGKLATISPVSTSVALSDASPYFFRTVPSDYIAARALAEYALNKIGKKKAVVYFSSQSAYSQSLKGEFSTAFSLGGGQVVSETDLSQSGFSSSQSLQAAQQQGADVVVILPNSSTLDKALQVLSANQKQLPVVAGDDVYSPKTLEVGGAFAEGTVVAIPWHIDASPDPSFSKRSRDLWYATVNWRTALSYDAVQAVAQALRTNPSREGVQQSLADPNFQTSGASGAIRFLPSGDRSGIVQLVDVQTGEGPGGYRFAPLP
ncbi:MAG: ABC transporter substrate-binding protein [Synechococcales cyanobacterium RU_4_20]|nr:ABC transporter substrate-binding protein [Synechococcales cyanobacterium RU_4_20]NJR68191.1 ABC transporter substrate-binding protein [Synechococcales cyanobacterium CRU_2_2]